MLSIWLLPVVVEVATTPDLPSIAAVVAAQEVFSQMSVAHRCQLPLTPIQLLSVAAVLAVSQRLEPTEQTPRRLALQPRAAVVAVVVLVGQMVLMAVAVAVDRLAAAVEDLALLGKATTAALQLALWGVAAAVVLVLLGQQRAILTAAMVAQGFKLTSLAHPPTTPVAVAVVPPPALMALVVLAVVGMRLSMGLTDWVAVVVVKA
jgi:hypothetical protein